MGFRVLCLIILSAMAVELSANTVIPEKIILDTLDIRSDSLKQGEIKLTEGPWYFHAGDDSTWADPSFDHTVWDTISPWLDLEKIDTKIWTGIGWFRKVIKIDSALRNSSAGMQMHHEGASEIFLNGKKVLTLGVVAREADQEIQKDPDYFPYIITFDSSTVYTLAVRYSNQLFHQHEYLYAKFFGHLGFSLALSEFNTSIEQKINAQIIQTATSSAVLGFMLAFGLIFFLLYFFYAKRKENLFFALFVSGIFLFFTSLNLPYFFRDSFEIITLLRFVQFAGFSLIFIYLLLFIYQIVYERIILLFWIFLSAFMVINLASFFGSGWVFSNFIPLMIVISILAIETIRIIVIGIRRKRENIRILAGGVILFLMMFFLIVLLSSKIITVDEDNILFDIIPFLLIIALPLSMAIYLAKSFGKTSEDLEKQIITVKEISARQVEQERQNAELRIRAERERAESERKSRELEEARQLQISMLPKILPELPGLQLAAYMKTATEVGGDYYDFHVSDKGILSVVLGDATGHGMKAGTMVTAAKSLFNSHATNPDIKSSFQEMNRNIKAMNFSRLAMCLTMVKIRNGSLSLSTAGMPPVYIYRANTGVIDEYLLKGMPLGSIKDFSYKTAETTLERGDAILLTTDGFPESQNIKGESYGYDRVKEVFQAAAHKAPDGIIDELKRAISAWAVQTEPEDDLTFVVIKKA